MKWFSFGAVLLLPGAAFGQCYSPPRYYAPTYYQTRYIDRYITQFVPVALPLYSAVYQPGVPVVPQAQQAMPKATGTNAANDTNAVILEALKRLDKRLGDIEQRVGGGTPEDTPPPARPPGSPTPTGSPVPVMPPADNGNTGQQPAPGDGSVLAAAQKLTVSKCAKCHGDATHQGSLTLVRGGQLVDPKILTPEQRVQILIRTYSQDPKLQMPPPGKGEAVTDEEYAVIAAWIAGRK